MHAAPAHNRRLTSCLCLAFLVATATTACSSSPRHLHTYTRKKRDKDGLGGAADAASGRSGQSAAAVLTLICKLGAVYRLPTDGAAVGRRRRKEAAAAAANTPLMPQVDVGNEARGARLTAQSLHATVRRVYLKIIISLRTDCVCRLRRRLQHSTKDISSSNNGP